MLYLTYPLDAVIMIALPVAVGVLLARTLGAKWGLFGVGALTFIASQVVHVPLNAGLTTLFARGVLPAPPVEREAAPPESVPPSPVPVAAPRHAPDPLKEKLEETRYQ